MEILGLSILIIFSIVGFAAIFFTTFGTLIILIGAILHAMLTDFSTIGLSALLILLILYLCGEVLEYFFIIAGAKKLGASNKACVGAIIGGILGAIAGAGFLGIGIIAGTFLGIFMGAFLVELIMQRDLIKSLKAGAGGVLGRIGSIIAKVLIAIAMLAIMISHVIKIS
ncbi:MAG: DUF456 domain-containing protein [Candidatus Omnitrophota bacterium]